MAIYLKSNADIEALITGAGYAAIAEARKRQIAVHFQQMLPSLWEVCLGIEEATMTQIEANFTTALFTDAPTDPGEPIPDPDPDPTPAVKVFVADLPALRAVTTHGVTPGEVRGATVAGKMGFWRTRVGSDAENAPFIVRPDDFDAATNAQVWEKQL